MAQASFVSFCQSKENLRVLEGKDFVELVVKFDYKEDSNIVKKILEGVLNAESIIRNSIDDLLEELNITDEADKEKFMKFRNLLRKADISKREKINVSENTVKKLDWDEVCQLFEQEVGNQKLSIAKSHTWYRYFEENSINGNVLIKMDRGKITKALQLNEGEASMLEDLMEKIQPDNEEKRTVSIKESNVALLATGKGNTKINGDVVVGHVNKK